jgi:hypothetical protein
LPTRLWVTSGSGAWCEVPVRLPTLTIG